VFFHRRQAMIEEFDLDQDGEISEAEFVSEAQSQTA
jgi:Ca2+-binding EF-hand superfamily protein